MDGSWLLDELALGRPLLKCKMPFFYFETFFIMPPVKKALTKRIQIKPYVRLVRENGCTAWGGQVGLTGGRGQM